MLIRSRPAVDLLSEEALNNLWERLEKTKSAKGGLSIAPEALLTLAKNLAPVADTLSTIEVLYDNLDYLTDVDKLLPADIAATIKDRIAESQFFYKDVFSENWGIQHLGKKVVQISDDWAMVGAINSSLGFKLERDGFEYTNIMYFNVSAQFNRNTMTDDMFNCQREKLKGIPLLDKDGVIVGVTVASGDNKETDYVMGVVAMPDVIKRSKELGII